MTIPQAVLVALAAAGLILAVCFYKKVLDFGCKIRDSVADFFLSFRYGNFTEREETVANIYLNYHYPVYAPYNGNCKSCRATVTSAESPRCPVCGMYICMNCGSCHPDCFERDEKIYVAEKETLAILKGKKKKAMERRIEAVKDRSNDKYYYCELLEKETQK